MPANANPNRPTALVDFGKDNPKVMRAAKAANMNLSVFIRIAVAEKMARDGLLRAKGPAS